MKKYFFFMLLALPITTMAQNVKIKKQQVYVNDSPYCQVDGKGLFNTEPGQEEFTIKSLSGNELILVKQANLKYMTVTFLTDGTKIKMQREDALSLNDKKDFIKKMLKNNLLQGDSINPAAKKIFLLKYDASEDYNNDRQTAIITNAVSANNNYTVIERNTNEELIISKEEIQQDNKTIGTYKIDEETIDANIKTIVTFYLPNGTKVAKLTADSFNASNNNLLTLKDNKLTSLSQLSDDMNVHEEDNIEKTVKWLIERGYL